MQRESHFSSSTQHQSMVGSTTSDKIKLETIEPSKEIEGILLLLLSCYFLKSWNKGNFATFQRHLHQESRNV